MDSLSPFVERRSRARLRETPLRRRTQCPSATLLRDRRRKISVGVDVASSLELQLDRYPTKPAMLTYLSSLAYSAERAGTQQGLYAEELKRAAEVVQRSQEPTEAIATLRGYQSYMALHGGVHERKTGRR